MEPLDGIISLKLLEKPNAALTPVLGFFIHELLKAFF